ncbi:MAG: hypothetical protein H7A24_11380 [Leptospiraceae bacterium]|nr:hypothetical protein [Leptospiraceae bacterium]MCP5512475.1 hypothetical protein [Leptospiraceae bacterium]
MGESEKTRQLLEERDFPILEKMSLDMKQLIQSHFQLLDTDTEAWPKRYSMKHGDLSLEWIFSAMGSVTLRPPRGEGLRRSPHPIFYLSIGKYNGTYVWEDLDANEISIEGEKVFDLVKHQIDLYFKFINTLNY